MHVTRILLCYEATGWVYKNMKFHVKLVGIRNFCFQFFSFLFL